MRPTKHLPYLTQSTPDPGGPIPLRAFPDAVGFGRFATGGRAVNSEIFEVNTLTIGTVKSPSFDINTKYYTGDLKSALEDRHTDGSGNVIPRIVVITVGGYYDRDASVINIDQPNLTLYGQFAPGGGFCANCLLEIRAPNVIMQGIRCRIHRARNTTEKSKHPGGINDTTSAASRDAGGVNALSTVPWNGGPVIVDHCSFSWGNDGSFDIQGINADPLNNVTYSNSITGETLSPHALNCLISNGTDRVDHIRNLSANGAGRSPTHNDKISYVSTINCLAYGGAYATCTTVSDSSSDWIYNKSKPATYHRNPGRLFETSGNTYHIGNVPGPDDLSRPSPHYDSVTDQGYTPETDFAVLESEMFSTNGIGAYPARRDAIDQYFIDKYNSNTGLALDKSDAIFEFQKAYYGYLDTSGLTPPYTGESTYPDVPAASVKYPTLAKPQPFLDPANGFDRPLDGYSTFYTEGTYPYNSGNSGLIPDWYETEIGQGTLDPLSFDENGYLWIERLANRMLFSSDINTGA